MAKKKITLETLSAQMTKAFATHGKEIQDLTETVSFVVKNMVTKDDIAEIRRDMATKDQLIALHTQVNAIETQLRDMRHTQLQARVADLEETCSAMPVEFPATHLFYHPILMQLAAADQPVHRQVVIDKVADHLELDHEQRARLAS